MNEQRRSGRPFLSRSHQLLVWTVSTAAVLVLAGCASTDSGPPSPRDGAATDTIAPAGEEHGRATVDEAEPVYGGTMVVGVLADVDGYHPIKNNWTTDGHFVGSSIFEPLMAYGPDGDLVPWLAESVTPNDDLTVWTVKVRPGITFHDGTPLDADAVQMNIEGAIFDGLASIAFEGTVDHVVAIDPMTVEIHLKDPYAVIPEVLAGVSGYVAAPSMLDDPNGGENPIGTGPFRFEEWIPGSSFSATANEEYWRTDDQGRRLPYLDRIEYRFLLDDDARFAALEAGDVDLILTTYTADIVGARQDQELVSVEDNLSEETFVMVNGGAPPFDNVHAREALAYGTDPHAVVAATQEDQALVATSPFAPSTEWEVADPGWVGYDPQRAARAVAAYEADAGHSLSFSISGIPTNDSLSVLQVLLQQWSELGIEAEIETLEPITYIAGVTFGDYEAAWFRSYSYHDPLYLYPFFHSRFANGAGTLSTNFSQVRNDDLDDLLVEGLVTTDVAERHRLNEEAVREINRELVDIWLFHTPYALIGRDVAGLNYARVVGFANLEPKPWIGGLWLDAS